MITESDPGKHPPAEKLARTYRETKPDALSKNSQRTELPMMALSFELPTLHEESSNLALHRIGTSVVSENSLEKNNSASFKLNSIEGDDQWDSETEHPEESGCLCSSKCCKIKLPRLPPAVLRASFWLYTHMAGPLSYLVFFVMTYAVMFSFFKEAAMPSTCAQYVKKVNATPNSPAPSKYELVVGCSGGSGLNIVILYALAFISGELMELLRLPGLLGMLLSGLAVRAVSTFATTQTIVKLSSTTTGMAPFNNASGNFSSLEAAYEYGLGMSADFATPVTDSLITFCGTLQVHTVLSARLRHIALATILSRAGLGLDPGVVRAVCTSVLRMAFIPCIVESMSAMVASKFLIGWPWSWAAMLGFVLAAVSPAVVVPNMIRLEVAGLGVNHGIPTLVMAASSLDDVAAITGFGVAMAVAFAQQNPLLSLVIGPAEVVGGATFGFVMGVVLWLIPPPGMEHGHVLRGILLVSVGLSAVVGSVTLNVPGAGALACLVFNFVVSMGWQRGMPWRLKRPAIPLASATSLHHTTTASNNVSRPALTNEHHDYYRQHLRNLRRLVRLNRRSAFSTVSRGRRFSLPEPTAEYETADFPHRQPSDDNLLDGRGGSRNTIGKDGLRKRISVVISRETEIEEARSTVTSPRWQLGPPENVGGEHIEGNDSHAAATSPEMARPMRLTASPTVRGQACLKKMRGFMAAMWWFVQPLLFCLIGADIKIESLGTAQIGRGMAALVIALVLRLIATVLAVTPSPLLFKERIFVALAWMPKATVQAAIGSMALDTARLTGNSQYIEWGEQILALAAMSILLTAPLGATLIMLTAPHLLTQDKPTDDNGHEQTAENRQTPGGSSTPNTSTAGKTSENSQSRL